MQNVQQDSIMILKLHNVLIALIIVMLVRLPLNAQIVKQGFILITALVLLVQLTVMTVMLLINVLLAVLDANGKHQQLLANKFRALQDNIMILKLLNVLIAQIIALLVRLPLNVKLAKQSFILITVLVLLVQLTVMTVMLLINVLLAVLDTNGKHQQLLANKFRALQDNIMMCKHFNA